MNKQPIRCNMKKDTIKRIIHGIYIYIQLKISRMYTHLLQIVISISISVIIWIQEGRNNSKYIIISISGNIPISTIVSPSLHGTCSVPSSFSYLGAHCRSRPARVVFENIYDISRTIHGGRGYKRRKGRRGRKRR